MQIKYIGKKRLMSVIVPVGVKSKKSQQTIVNFAPGQVQEMTDTDGMNLLQLNSKLLNMNELSKDDLLSMTSDEPIIVKEGEKFRRFANFIEVGKAPIVEHAMETHKFVEVSGEEAKAEDETSEPTEEPNEGFKEEAEAPADESENTSIFGSKRKGRKHKED